MSFFSKISKCWTLIWTRESYLPCYPTYPLILEHFAFMLLLLYAPILPLNIDTIVMKHSLLVQDAFLAIKGTNKFWTLFIRLFVPLIFNKISDLTFLDFLTADFFLNIVSSRFLLEKIIHFPGFSEKFDAVESNCISKIYNSFIS